MTKILIAAAGVAVLACAGAASAKKGADARVQAAVACTTIAQSDARLRCYDQAMIGLQQVVATASLPDDSEPLKLEGVIKAAGESGYNRFWVQLDSGDRWAVTANSSSDPVPQIGRKVALKKAMFGSYWFKQSSFPAQRAKYLGRN